MRKTVVVFALTLAVVASVFVCGSARACTLMPWNVAFTVSYNGDEFCYDLSEHIDRHCDPTGQGFYLGMDAKREMYRDLTALGLPHDAVHNYMLPGFDEVVKHFSYLCCERRDASVSFGKNGFSYQKGQDSVQINEDELFQRALHSGGRAITIELPLNIDKAVTVEELRRNTVCRGTFTTSYSSSSANRCHNIALAASALNGVTVEVGESFSFNDVVGPRTEANGYKTGKVILDGAYTDGVGGGVCQVSTTLYNALLLSGFVPCAVQHSLVSSYVKPGFDAMVSYGSADLTFVNNTSHPLYIASVANGKQLTFTVYGEPNQYKIVRESEEVREGFATTFVVDPQKYPELVYTDQTKVIVGGSDGVRTKSYLKYYLGGKLVATKLIRTNNYKRVDAVVASGYLARPQEEAG